MSTNETTIELPAVVTYADLVVAEKNFRQMYDEGCAGGAMDAARARLNAIAERLGLVDVPSRVEALKITTKRVMNREAEK